MKGLTTLPNTIDPIMKAAAVSARGHALKVNKQRRASDAIAAAMAGAVSAPKRAAMACDNDNGGQRGGGGGSEYHVLGLPVGALASTPERLSAGDSMVVQVCLVSWQCTCALVS